MTRLAPDRTAVDASNFFTPALTSAGLPKSGPDPNLTFPNFRPHADAWR
jgi:hypothetical protein